MTTESLNSNISIDFNKKNNTRQPKSSSGGAKRKTSGSFTRRSYAPHVKEPQQHQT
jgi:hypothetical protein